MKLVIIGSGNVATVLSKKIIQAEHEIIQVAGRNVETVRALASYLNVSYTTNLRNISQLADLYVIAVSDAAIANVASDLKLNQQIVVHTAGAVPAGALNVCSANYGVLYPLQTFSKGKMSLPKIPVVIEANNEFTKQRLAGFASAWAESVAFADDNGRLKLHLSAVLVNNFTNHLLALSEQFCEINLMNFNILRPLIEETIIANEGVRFATLQTGPAVRGDVRTIEKHRKMLQSNPPLAHLYNAVTESIISFYNGR